MNVFYNAVYYYLERHTHEAGVIGAIMNTKKSQTYIHDDYSYCVYEQISSEGKKMYRTRIPTGERNDKGIPKYKDITGKTKTAVRLKADAFINKLIVIQERRSKGLSDEGMTVAELAEKFMADKTQEGKSLRASTAALYWNIINVHIIPALGDKEISSLDYDILQEFVDTKLGYSRQMVKDIKSILKQMFDFAMRKKYVKENPALLIKVYARESEPVEALSERQEKVLVKVLELLPHRLDSHYGISRSIHFKKTFATALLLVLNCGLRKGELFGLPTECVDIQNGTIRVRQQLVFDKKKIYGKISNRLKTKASYRVIPIPDEIRDILAEHKKYAEELGHTLMFCKEDGEPYTYSDIRRRLETVNKMCNEISLLEPEPFEFEKFTLHQLRHTYCTHLYESGIDLFAAQYFMGHDKGKVTMDIYTSLREKHTQTAAAAVRKINFTSISPEIFMEGGANNG